MLVSLDLAISDLLYNTTCLGGNVQQLVKLYRDGQLHDTIDELTLARSTRAAHGRDRACPKGLLSPLRRSWLKV